MNLAPPFLAALLLAVLLGAAAWQDLRRRIIPNRLNAAIALAAPLMWWAEGLTPWPGAALQLALAGVVFASFAGLFALGMMGGGDVKLIGALALWLPLAQLAPMLVLTALAGGIVTLATLLWVRLARRGADPEVPYGVAIAFAGIACLGERYLYQIG